MAKAKIERAVLAECTAKLEIGLIRPSPDNPRKSFPKDEIAQLASTLADTGPDQDIVVRPIGENAKFTDGQWSSVDYYEVIDGDRRHRAAKVKGLKTLQCKVRALSDDEAADARLISFAQRVDLLPSELARAYADRAATGKTAEQIAAAVGKPLGFVRSLLRLAKLPEWAFDDVDSGRLPRATAELIARVPGELSRAKTAACVLLGQRHPAGVMRYFSDDGEFIEEKTFYAAQEKAEVLSYRDTRELIHQHFTRELKTAPFDRKSLELLPEAGSCDLCPSRAGNNEEATAEGVRADQCLNPECFRAKEDAYREAVTAKATAAGTLAAYLEIEGFDRPPRGWTRLDVALAETELSVDFAGYQGDALTKKLKPTQLPQKYLAWGKQGKAVYLVKTSEARKALIEAGVIKKADSRRKETTAKPESNGAKNGQKAAEPETNRADPVADTVAVEDRAIFNAGRILSEYGAEQFEQLASLDDAEPGRPVHDGLKFLTRFLIRDHCSFGPPRIQAVKETFNTNGQPPKAKAEEAIAAMTAPQLLATCLRLIVNPILDGGHAEADFAEELLGWAELDMPGLRETAKRELQSGKTVEERLDELDKAEVQAPAPKASKAWKKGKKKVPA